MKNTVTCAKLWLKRWLFGFKITTIILKPFNFYFNNFKYIFESGIEKDIYFLNK